MEHQEQYRRISEIKENFTEKLQITAENLQNKKINQDWS